MKRTKNIWLIVFLCLQGVVFSQINTCQSAKKAAQTYTLYYSQANHRSDTIDILKFTINLDITDYAGQTIKGNTQVRFAPKINGQTMLRLDLLKMTIDSIRMNSAPLTYAYNDTLLKVALPTAMNTIDTNTVTVYYHGHPQGDPAGWGGFHLAAITPITSVLVLVLIRTAMVAFGFRASTTLLRSLNMSSISLRIHLSRLIVTASS